MKSDNYQSRLYNFNKAVKSAIQAQKIQGHSRITCNAQLYRKGKKLNSIEKASSSNFSKLILNYVKNEDPDKLKVELFGDQDELLWSKSFNIEAQTFVDIPQRTEFQGFGEVEVANIVSKKISEIRREEELKELRSLRDQLETENQELQNQLGELEESLAAKKTIEYYSNIIGLALPGLAKVLSKTSLGSSLGFLAGTSEPQPAAIESNPEKDQRQTIIDLVTEFMQGLDLTLLGHLYLVFVELSNNPALISTLLNHLTQKEQQS